MGMMYKSALPKPYSPAEEREIARKVYDGDREARDAMVEHNLRLVYDFAYRYKGTTKIEFDDLVDLGCMGLVRAVDTFNPEAGGAVFDLRRPLYHQPHFDGAAKPQATEPGDFAKHGAGDG